MTKWKATIEGTLILEKVSESPSASPSGSNSASGSHSTSVSNSPSVSASKSPSTSASKSPSSSPSESGSSSVSASPSQSPSASISGSPSESNSPSPSDSPSVDTLFSEDFSSGTFGQFSPLFIPGDECDATGKVAVDTTDHRPGASDNYAYHVFPPQGDFAACCQGPEAFSIGEGEEFWVTFWVKYKDTCTFDSCAGKMPEINGTGAARDRRARITFSPGATGEDWSIPQPPEHNGVRYAFIPTVLMYSNYDDTWHPVNDAASHLWSQNINTANPIYIERGNWYKIKMYVYPHVTNGRVRVWINDTEILDTALSGGINTIYSSSDHFTQFNAHFLYNDHGGSGANDDFEIWLDDILITSTDPDS